MTFSPVSVKSWTAGNNSDVIKILTSFETDLHQYLFDLYFDFSEELAPFDSDLTSWIEKMTSSLVPGTWANNPSRLISDLLRLIKIFYRDQPFEDAWETDWVRSIAFYLAKMVEILFDRQMFPDQARHVPKPILRMIDFHRSHKMTGYKNLEADVQDIMLKLYRWYRFTTSFEPEKIEEKTVEVKQEIEPGSDAQHPIVIDSDSDVNDEKESFNPIKIDLKQKPTLSPDSDFEDDDDDTEVFCKKQVGKKSQPILVVDSDSEDEVSDVDDENPQPKMEIEMDAHAPFLHPPTPQKLVLVSTSTIVKSHLTFGGKKEMPIQKTRRFKKIFWKK